MIGLIKGTARQARTVSGLPLPIASYKSNSKLPIQELSLSINPTQSGSGDPAPDNIRPITGVSSVNVYRFSGPNYWDEQWESGGYDNTTGAKNVQYGRIRNKNLIKVNPSTTYYVKFTSSAFVVLQYDINKNFIAGVSSYTSSGVLNTSANTAYINFYLVANDYGNDISINYPSTDTSYHAYTGNTYLIQLGDTYYGATLDVVDGEVVATVDRKYITANDLSWTFSTDFVYASISDTDVTQTTEYPNGKRPVTCNIAKYQDSTGPDTNKINWGGAGYNNKNLFIKNSYTDSLANWETYISNNTVQFVYYITPFTVNLDSLSIPSLLGSNNIWHDGNGDVESLKFMDRQLYFGR